VANKPILCVDFDGVIHSYTSGWKGECEIPDLPVAGALDWLYRASEWWRVCIYSSRSKEPGAIDAMKAWIRKHADNEFQGLVTADMLLEIIEFPDQKPAAFLTIDDRAICFDGRWPSLDPQKLLDFKPWNKQDFGATGRFPQGQLSDDDEGELRMGVAWDRLAGVVRVAFGKPIEWIGLPPPDAIALGELLIKRARERR
jgi:hypothetical protein